MAPESLSPTGKFLVKGTDGKEYGPVDSQELIQWVQEGRIAPETPIRNVLLKTWKQAMEFSELIPHMPPEAFSSISAPSVASKDSPDTDKGGLSLSKPRNEFGHATPKPSLPEPTTGAVAVPSAAGHAKEQGPTYRLTPRPVAAGEPVPGAKPPSSAHHLMPSYTRVTVITERERGDCSHASRVISGLSLMLIFGVAFGASAVITLRGVFGIGILCMVICALIFYLGREIYNDDEEKPRRLGIGFVTFMIGFSTLLAGGFLLFTGEFLQTLAFRTESSLVSFLEPLFADAKDFVQYTFVVQSILWTGLLLLLIGYPKVIRFLLGMLFALPSAIVVSLTIVLFLIDFISFMPLDTSSNPTLPKTSSSSKANERVVTPRSGGTEYIINGNNLESKNHNFRLLVPPKWEVATASTEHPQPLDPGVVVRLLNPESKLFVSVVVEKLNNPVPLENYADDYTKPLYRFHTVKELSTRDLNLAGMVGRERILSAKDREDKIVVLSIVYLRHKSNYYTIFGELHGEPGDKRVEQFSKLVQGFDLISAF